MAMLLFSTAHRLYGQDGNTRGEYAFVAYIGGGMGYYTTGAGTPVAVQSTTSKWGFAGTVRVLWHPDHLLRVGLETGHMTFYSYKFTDSAGKSGKTSITGVPLLLVASMPITARLNAFFGTGFYNMTTNLDYAGTNDAHKLSVGWMLATSYIQPVSKNLGLGIELKWMDAAQTVDAAIVGQLQLVWKFLKW
jgi:hypothetical protein